MELATEDKLKRANNCVLRRGSATLLLIGAEWAHYGTMKNQMQQSMAMHMNNYATSMDETTNILNTFANTSKTMFGKKIAIKMKGQKFFSPKPEI